MILVWATGLLHPVFERSKWSIFTPCVHNGDPRNSMLRSQLTISRGAAAAMAQLLCQSLLHISLRRARTIKHGYHTRVMKPDAKKRFQRLNYLILNQLPIIGRTKRVTVKNSTFKNCKRQLCFLKKGNMNSFLPRLLNEWCILTEEIWNTFESVREVSKNWNK